MNSAHPAAGATWQLASFVAEFPQARVPESARHAARRALVNIIGCCVGAAEHDIVTTALRAVQPFAGEPTSALLGRSERLDAVTAALINGLSSAAYSFDDTHSDVIIHPSGAATAALLAHAGAMTLRGSEFLHAFIVGVDVACRVSKAVSLPPAEGDVGWSQTGIAAGIGASAAVARAMRLPAAATCSSLAIAAGQASGFRAAHGTMAATLLFGTAAETGLKSAILARQGFTGPTEALEGKFGYSSLFAKRAHEAYLTQALGERFEVEQLAFKPYPCGVVIHPAVDAALAWRRSAPLRPEAIEHIRIKVHPDAMALGYRRQPGSVLEAKVSLCHWVAAALVSGRAGIAEGQLEVINDSLITRLRSIIQIDPQQHAAPDRCSFTAEGGAYSDTVEIEHCKGSVDNPMSDGDLDEKFLLQVRTRLSDAQARHLLHLCWNVDELTDVSELAHASCEPAPGRARQP